MPKPPALRLEGRERALDLVLRASADLAATGERKPMASVEASSAAMNGSSPASRAAPALATTSPSGAATALPNAALLACESRRYCWRRA
jgi:cytoskeletal protein RodZ